MKASDFLAHCRHVAHWVNWDKTCDQFMAGDPDAEVRGIAVTWLATNNRLREAAERGLNFVIAHEGAFYPQYANTPSGDRHHAEKRQLVEERGITLLRCHDTWDRMPDVGIPDAWAQFLGFETEPRPVGSFYRICLVGDLTLEQLARCVLERTRGLGQEALRIVGEPSTRASRMAVGTGAITRLAEMHELRPDVILATDDGISTTASGLWSSDLGIPLIVVNHATTELPGMMAMVGYIEKRFPNIPVTYLPGDFPSQILLEQHSVVRQIQTPA